MMKMTRTLLLHLRFNSTHTLLVLWFLRQPHAAAYDSAADYEIHPKMSFSSFLK